MAYYPLITDGQFKALTGWSYQIDTNWLNANARTAQEKYIEDLLTTALYLELMGQVETNTLTTANELLLEVVKPALAWRIAQDAIVGQLVRVANIGVVSNTGQNEQPNMKVPAALRGDYQVNAEFYEKRVLRFLSENKSDYPLYKTNACDSNQLHGGDTGIGYPAYVRRYVERGR